MYTLDYLEYLKTDRIEKYNTGKRIGWNVLLNNHSKLTTKDSYLDALKSYKSAKAKLLVKNVIQQGE